MTKLDVLTLLVVTAAASQSHDWRQADPDYEWNFPNDHWSHEGYRTEWWYFTGRLKTAREPIVDFGYQFAIFRIGVRPELPPLQSGWSARSVLMGHAAITDITGGKHHFTEIVYRAAPILADFNAFPDSVIARAPGPPGTESEWTLEWTGEGFRFSMADDAQGIAFTIDATSSSPILWQGPNGFSRKNAEGSAASMYYSIPRLTTVGTISIDGKTLEAKGMSWMDREFSSTQLGADQAGWDWFGLQLDGGRSLTVYRLRQAGGNESYSHLTLAEPSGEPRYIGPNEWKLVETGSWHSPATGTTYPAGWRISVPSTGLEIEITPLVADQENVSRLVSDLAYWEGAVSVTDESRRPIGRGYAELTGYGRTRRPAF